MMKAAFFMSMLSIMTLTMGQLRGATKINSRIRMKQHGKSESALQRKEELNNMFKSEREDSRSRMGVRDLLFHFATQQSKMTGGQEKKKRKMRRRRKGPTPFTADEIVIKTNPTPAPMRRKKMTTKKKMMRTNVPNSNPTPTPKLDQNKIVYGLQPSCNSVNDAGYNICLDLVSISGSRASWMDAFAKAKQRWESIIVGDQPNVQSTSISLPAGTELCTGFPSTIDDVYICGREDRIDGLYGILGWAGPTFVRASGVINPRTGRDYLTTVTGRMKFDTADIARLLTDGELENLVLHEMAHVLGLGTLWEMNGLYMNGSGRYASGTRADAEWKRIGCSGPLPVELDYGSGTRDGHWDEECLVDELMTGLVLMGSPSGLPLSRITIGSMEDLGLVVDYSQADAFTIGDLGVCGTFCPAEKRRLRVGKGRVKLSSNDMKYILHYAKSELAPLHQEWKAAEMRQGDSDDEIVAFDGIIVFFKDKAGHLHDVPVSWDDVKDFDI